MRVQHEIFTRYEALTEELRELEMLDQVIISDFSPASLAQRQARRERIAELRGAKRELEWVIS